MKIQHRSRLLNLLHHLPILPLLPNPTQLDALFRRPSSIARPFCLHGHDFRERERICRLAWVCCLFDCLEQGFANVVFGRNGHGDATYPYSALHAGVPQGEFLDLGDGFRGTVDDEGAQDGDCEFGAEIPVFGVRGETEGVGYCGLVGFLLAGRFM